MDSRRSASLGWFALAVLVLAYAVSFIDRQVVALLVEPLKHDLHLTDSEIGLVQGPAFGIFYALLGMPLGALADRVHRLRLIAAGIFLWSAATMASGFATTFGGLFAARMCVGIGEAALVPAAVSLLADLFQPEKRSLPMSILTSGASMGAGLSLILGGWFVSFAGHSVGGMPLVGPWLATRQVWGVVFILAGALGIPIIAAVLLLREPERGVRDGAPAATRPDMRYLLAHRRLFGPLLGGAGLLYIFTNAFSAWMPSFFIRQFHWVPADLGARLGVATLICAMSGSVASGLVSTWISRRRPHDAPILTMLLGGSLLAPLAVLVPLSSDPSIAMFGVVGIYFAIGLCFGVATAAFIGITPAPLRGRIVALYLLIGNLLGLGFGPYLVGALLDHVLRDPLKVGAALSLVALFAMVPGLILIASVWRRYGRAFLMNEGVV